MTHRLLLGCATCLVVVGCTGHDPVEPIGPPQQAMLRPELVRSWGTEGSGDGEFVDPNDTAINSRGDIFVVDTSNHRIQKFDATGAFLRSWGRGGHAEGEFDFPAGIAVDERDRVYVADSRNNRIQIFDANGEFLSMWGQPGTNDGELFYPSKLAVKEDLVFVADFTQRIQRYTVDGQFEAGWHLYDGSLDEFPGVRDISVDSRNQVWVAESAAARIRKFDSSGKLLASWGRAGGMAGAFYSLTSMDIAPGGEILVTDRDGRIQMFDAGGRFIVQWRVAPACAEPNQVLPLGLTVSRTNHVVVLDVSNRRVHEFAFRRNSPSPTWWAWGGWGSPPGRFAEPTGISVDAHGRVFVSDRWRGVQVFAANGDFLEELVAGEQREDDFGTPHGVATFEDRVYVADGIRQAIFVFDLLNRFVGTWDVGARPSGIATDMNGNVYVCAASVRIDVFDSTGVRVRSWNEYGPTGEPFRNVTDVAVDAEGTVYVAETLEHRILRFDTSGAFLGEFVVLPQTFSTIGLDVASNGNVFVSVGHEIFQYDATGNEIATWGRNGVCEGEFDDIADIAVDGEGRVFVTDAGNRRVQAFVPPYPSRVAPSETARGKRR